MKNVRHALILEIIAEKQIETQEELAQELLARNVKVTQATVSRDIKELRLTKVLNENGKYSYSAPEKNERTPGDRYMRIFSESVVSITGAGNLIVLKTITASAQSAAEAVDSMEIPEIVGTIAGDNTVLVIVGNIEDVDGVIARFEAITGKLN